MKTDLGKSDRAVANNPEAAGVRPRYITFTGADEHTSVDGMAALSRRYPIEWGILFSPKRQGEGRYPPISKVREIVSRDGLHLSAHLCGGHGRDVLTRSRVDIRLDGFERAQINSAEHDIDVSFVAEWARGVGVRAILQCRGAFPASTEVAWLFDKSGGRGVAPASWPKPHPAMSSGYAGGIGPDNVLEVIAAIKATDYWIDMESGVRDENDRFSLDRCRAVCEAVYGRPIAASGSPLTELAERLSKRILVKHGGTGDPWRDHWNLTESDSLLHKDALAAMQHPSGGDQRTEGSGLSDIRGAI